MELNKDTSKVLVIDDEPLILMANEIMLEDYAAQVFTAGNGVKALEILTANPDIDLVVSDWNMPEMDGMELFTAMRQRGFQQPFLMSSAQDAEGQADAEARFIQDGNAVFKQKPLIQGDLLQALSELRPAPNGYGNPALRA